MHKYRPLDIVEDNTGDTWKILRTEGIHTDEAGNTWPRYVALGPLQQKKPQPTSIFENHLTQKINVKS